jgi:hypothetical protein
MTEHNHPDDADMQPFIDSLLHGATVYTAGQAGKWLQAEAECGDWDGDGKGAIVPSIAGRLVPPGPDPLDRWRVLVVCPYCQREHSHDAGAYGTEGYGHRDEPCQFGDGVGYVIAVNHKGE